MTDEQTKIEWKLSPARWSAMTPREQALLLRGFASAILDGTLAMSATIVLVQQASAQAVTVVADDLSPEEDAAIHLMTTNFRVIMEKMLQGESVILADDYANKQN